MSIVSIAGVKDGMSFSSDTGMAECLVIARKRKTTNNQNNRAAFVSLLSRPADLSQSFAVSKSIAKTDTGRQLEDGPFGGEVSYCGDVVAGETIDAPIGQVAIGWGAARLRDASVAQTAHALANGKLWLARPTPINPDTCDDDRRDWHQRVGFTTFYQCCTQRAVHEVSTILGGKLPGAMESPCAV